MHELRRARLQATVYRDIVTASTPETDEYRVVGCLEAYFDLRYRFYRARPSTKSPTRESPVVVKATNEGIVVASRRV